MEELQHILERIDGRGYKAYRDILGEWAFPGFRLLVDHVQADPYAAPSRMRALVPVETAQLPEALSSTRARSLATRDYIARAFRNAAQEETAIRIDAGGRTVLERTAVLLHEGAVELRFTLSLPARGRSIQGRKAAALLCRQLPGIVRRAATAEYLDVEAARHHAEVVEDQQALRAQLAERDLVAFVADGSTLPRRSGVDERPLPDAVGFHAPPTLQVTLDAPNAGPVRGMGVPRGISLIVGGGFHGKSTLLSAIEQGVYDQIPGDGCEYVVTEASAVKVRAEDGRSVQAVNLSPYINHLPYGKSTDCFSTDLASGSTSQAAALQEALEAGADSILVDEDTSATNFMIRDERMQALVAREQEPITPFVDRIRQLRDEVGVSTVLVMGGSGDYFDCADTVIQMQEYLPQDVTERARAIAASHVTGRREEGEGNLQRPAPRTLDPRSLNPETKPGKRKVQARGRDLLIFGRTDVDLRAVEQIADASQVRVIGLLLARLADQGNQVTDVSAFLRTLLEEHSLVEFSRRPDGDLALPRVAEIMAALNRLRGTRFS